MAIAKSAHSFPKKCRYKELLFFVCWIYQGQNDGKRTTTGRREFSCRSLTSVVPRANPPLHLHAPTNHGTSKLPCPSETLSVSGIAVGGSLFVHEQLVYDIPFSVQDRGTVHSWVAVADSSSPRSPSPSTPSELAADLRFPCTPYNARKPHWH